jgi:hypothetical protein
MRATDLTNSFSSDVQMVQVFMVDLLLTWKVVYDLTFVETLSALNCY